MIKFSTILSIPTLDEFTVQDAKSLFLGYKDRNVIIHGSFEDNKWFMSDEYSNVNLNFSISDYEPYKEITGIPENEFIDCLKAYVVFCLGDLGLLSIQEIVSNIKQITENTDVPHLNRVIEFFSLLPGDRDDYIDKLEKIEDEQIRIPKSQRKLASFMSYFIFDDIIKKWWREAADTEEKLFFFPVYLWWQVTGILPTRPKEFLVTPRNCLKKHGDQWILTVRKDKLKGRNKKTSYKIGDDFAIRQYEITESLASDIQWYLEKTEDFIPTELNTLFRTDSHYAQWDRSKPHNSRYYTYANLATALRYFYRIVIAERYGYNIVYDANNMTDNDIEFLSLGDTRHLTMINAIANGATPMIVMVLAGHDNPDMSSHYYTNITNLIECKTYRMYKKFLNGHEKYAISKYSGPLQINGYTEVDGGRCYSPKVKTGDFTDCYKASGSAGEIGLCSKCTYFRAVGKRFSSEKKKYVNDIETDCRNLDEIVKQVRKEKGYPEDIMKALMQLRASEYSYEQYLMETYNNGSGEDNDNK